MKFAAGELKLMHSQARHHFARKLLIYFIGLTL